MSKQLRALAFLSAFEIVIYLFVATVAWAVADHDLATLDGSFFSEVRARPHAQVMGAIQILILALNALMFIKIMRAGEKTVALLGLLVAGGVVSLFFLPTMFSVYGLGGLIGLAAAYKILGVFWKGLSWPFRKLFGRKKTADSPAPDAKTAAPPKKAS